LAKIKRRKSLNGLPHRVDHSALVITIPKRNTRPGTKAQVWQRETMEWMKRDQMRTQKPYSSPRLHPAGREQSCWPSTARSRPHFTKVEDFVEFPFKEGFQQWVFLPLHRTELTPFVQSKNQKRE
jgi:hypothetical protein